MGSTIAFLLPILLGGLATSPVFRISEIPGIYGIIALLGPIIIISFIAMVAVSILSIIPLIGRFIANSPGMRAFLEGAIIFRLLTDGPTDQILTEANVQSSVYPDFWTFVGFLIIAGVLGRVVVSGLALLSMPLEGTALGELMPIVITPVWEVLGGIIPLLMFSSYVRLSIKQLII